MIKKPVCLVPLPVKTSKKIEVRYFWIHSAKVWKDFGFRKWDFGFTTNLIATVK